MIGGAPDAGRRKARCGWVCLTVGAGAVGLLGACGSASTSGGSSSSSGGAGGAPPACSVITQNDAAALLGSSVSRQDSGHVCIWTGANGGSLNVQAYAPGIDPKATVRSGRACGSGSPNPVSIGDAAEYCSTASATGSSVVFAKGGLLVQIQCDPGPSSSTTCDKSRFIAAAQAAAGRL